MSQNDLVLCHVALCHCLSVGTDFVDSEENAAIYVCVVIFFYGLAIVSLIGLNMKSTENARQRRGDTKVS